MTGIDLRKQGQAASVWCDQQMGLIKELGRVAGVGEELRVWFCVLSQMVQLQTAAKGGVWAPKTTSIPAAFLAAVPVTVRLQGELHGSPQKVKFYIKSAAEPPFPMDS